MEWYHVCWPRLTAKRVEPVVSISWASCIIRLVRFSYWCCEVLVLLTSWQRLLSPSLCSTLLSCHALNFAFISCMYSGTHTYTALYAESNSKKKDKNSASTSFDKFKLDFKSRIWFTYRTDLPALPDSRLKSDIGWGCMLRCGQMLLAQAFIVHFLHRGTQLCIYCLCDAFSCWPPAIYCAVSKTQYTHTHTHTHTHRVVVVVIFLGYLC